jgi:hypothetical protein
MPARRASGRPPAVTTIGSHRRPLPARVSTLRLDLSADTDGVASGPLSGRARHVGGPVAAGRCPLIRTVLNRDQWPGRRIG